MLCYVGENGNGLYTLGRDKLPDTQEIEVSSQDIQELIDIPYGEMLLIQQKINYILYASQQKLPLGEPK